MKTKETSTREQALAWWNNLKFDYKSKLIKLYTKNLMLWDRNPDSLTGREIEEIWLKETQNHTNDSMGTVFTSSIDSQNTIKPNQKQYSQEENKKEYIQRVGRVNRKQFKQFDESLFKAYINKFSNEDKLKAFQILAKELYSINYGKGSIDNLLIEIGTWK